MHWSTLYGGREGDSRTIGNDDVLDSLSLTRFYRQIIASEMAGGICIHIREQCSILYPLYDSMDKLHLAG